MKKLHFLERNAVFLYQAGECSIVEYLSAASTSVGNENDWVYSL